MANGPVLSSCLLLVMSGVIIFTFYVVLKVSFSLIKNIKRTAEISVESTPQFLWRSQIHYRLQTKLWEGNVLTPVCHSVHGGGHLDLQRASQGHMTNIQGGLHPRGLPEAGFYIQGVCLQGGLHLGGLGRPPTRY